MAILNSSLSFLVSHASILVQHGPLGLSDYSYIFIAYVAIILVNFIASIRNIKLEEHTLIFSFFTFLKQSMASFVLYH